MATTPDWMAKTATGIVAPIPGIEPVAPIDPTKTQAQATGYDAATGKPTNWTVDAPQTVQGQVNGIVAGDSPLMQRAAARSLAQMNSRGLANSSMAVGAGQEAVIAQALPIAQQDAQTYGAAAKYKADAANAMDTFNAGALNTARQFTAGSLTDASKFNAQTAADTARANQQTALAQSQQGYDAAVKAALQGADMAGRENLAKLDGQIRMSLGEIEAQYKTGMQSSASMAETYTGLVNNITAIMANPDMDGAAKQAAINNVTTLYNNALATQEAIAGMNLGELLSFGAVGGAPAPAPGAPAPTAPTPSPVGPPAPPSVWPGSDGP